MTTEFRAAPDDQDDLVLYVDGEAILDQVVFVGRLSPALQDACAAAGLTAPGEVALLIDEKAVIQTAIDIIENQHLRSTD